MIPLVAALVGCGEKDTVLVPVRDPCTPPLSIIPATDYSPTWAPRGDHVAYVHVDGTVAIYVTDTTGTATPTKLCDGSGQDTGELAWSPGGSLIAMRLRGDIWTVDATSGVLRQWTNNASNYPHWPSWSPDGRYLAYTLIAKPTTAPDSSWGVRIIDTWDGTERALLHDGLPTLSGSRLAWSADGSIIVSCPLTSQVIYELFTLKADGSGYRQLTTLNGSARAPAWSADGSLLFFDFIRGPCNQAGWLRETWALDKNLSGVRKWTLPFSDPGVARSYPFEISKSSGYVVSVGRDSAEATGVIVSMHTDGSRKKRLTSSPQAAAARMLRASFAAAR
jgi:Tol biopolymer transport system component